MPRFQFDTKIGEEVEVEAEEEEVRVIEAAVMVKAEKTKKDSHTKYSVPLL